MGNRKWGRGESMRSEMNRLNYSPNWGQLVPVADQNTGGTECPRAVIITIPPKKFHCSTPAVETQPPNEEIQAPAFEIASPESESVPP